MLPLRVFRRLICLQLEISVRLINWWSNLKLTGTKPPRAKCTRLRLLGSCTEGSGSLGLRLTKSSGAGSKSAGSCGCGAFEELAVKAGPKHDARTESTASLLLAESRIACAENTSGLLLRL